MLVFNGEIYNHLALRRQLPEQAWRGHSDTETLLACIESWGLEESLRRCAGMFALAVWNCTERTLQLARDRMGEKPLYYGWQHESLFLFASELKAIAAHPRCRLEVDRDALTLLLRYNYIPAPHSIYKGICKLRPGCLLRVQPDGQTEERCWWSLPEEAERAKTEPFSGSEEEAAACLEQVLDEAVAEQSAADVPLGAFLSGGIDSSLLAALMRTHCSRVRTFTVGFAEAAHDESAHARAVARHLGTEHTEFQLSPLQALEVIPLLPALYDEPFADSSQLPTFLVARTARQHVTVALSGDGGDELFGGYNRYFWATRIWNKIDWLPLPARRLLGRLLLLLPPQGWDRLAQAAGKGGIQLGDKSRKLAERLAGVRNMNDLHRSLVSAWPEPASLVQDGQEPATVLTSPWAWLDRQPPEERMMLLDALTYLPDDILCKVDRAAMGVSLETRAPFLDHRVVELALRLPLRMKIRDGQGKRILRRILYKHVPRQLVERPKQGFGIPLAEWLRGPLRDWAESLLDADRLRREGFLHPAPVRLRWQEHLSGRRSWEYSLWAVLMFQAWLDAARQQGD